MVNAASSSSSAESDRSADAAAALHRPRAQPARFYRAARGVVKASLKLFYRNIEMTGVEHLDRNAPTILASNHPNSIVDPLLVGLFERRQVSFCARDGLFDVPLFGRLLRAVGAIPIARRHDHKGGKPSNDRAFDAVREVLTNHGVISIFPEGKTHTRLKVQQLKTGAARMALDAESASDFELGVKVVPVALNYLVRHAFRSDIHVAFGPAIDTRQFEDLARTDPRAATRAITDALSEAIKRLSVHVEEQEDERLIAQVTAIMVDIRQQAGLDIGGQSPAERVALARRVLDAYRWLEETKPMQCAELRDRIMAYADERSDLGLGGEHAVFQHRKESTWAFLYGDDWRGHLTFILGGLPIALHGLCHSLAPYWTLRTLLRVTNPRHDRRAFTKLLGGALVFSAIWSAQTIAVSTLLGPVVGVIYGATLLPSAIFFLRYSRETSLHRLNLRSLKGRLLGRDRLEMLRAERDALHAELRDLREEYLAHIDEGPSVSNP